jgi:hypothetical protein
MPLRRPTFAVLAWRMVIRICRWTAARAAVVAESDDERLLMPDVWRHQIGDGSFATRSRANRIKYARVKIFDDGGAAFRAFLRRTRSRKHHWLVRVGRRDIDDRAGSAVFTTNHDGLRWSQRMQEYECTAPPGLL